MAIQCMLAFLLVSQAFAGAASAQGNAAAAPTDRFVMVGSLRIHYVDWGNSTAPPLVMIHGLDRVARTFDHVAPHFTGRFHVIALDMRGHGDSGWDPAGRYQVEDHAGDL